MKKILNIFYSFIGILGGYLVSNLINTISIDMITSGKNGDYGYTAAALCTILIGTFFYIYGAKIVRSMINSKEKIIGDKTEIFNLIVYIISLLVSSYLIFSKLTSGDTPLFATIILAIFNIILCIRLYTYENFYLDFFIAPLILSSNKKKYDKAIKKENNKRIIFNILGLIFGIIFSMLIVLFHKVIFSLTITSDKEMNNILRFILVIIFAIVLLFIINAIIVFICKKNYNREYKFFYTIKDYFIDTFHISYTILTYILFISVLNINIYLAFVYMFIIKIIICNFIPTSTNPDYKPSKDTSIKFSYGNSGYNPSSSNDIKFGFFSNGTSYFSMDLGAGISTTTYTDKDGNKTDVTSFEITDNLEYKSISKR